MGFEEEAEKGSGDGEAAEKSESCSICLETIAFGGDRSTAKLQCGHEFHLDCIGSAFNAKGVMQCPNCRKIEKGNWLYANGSRSQPELNMDEWVHDEDLYDHIYPELPLGVHWCPFGRVEPVPSIFEEGDSSPPVTLEDFLRQYTMFPAISAADHPCPSYVTYWPPLQPSSSSNSHLPSHIMADGPSYNNQWSHVPRRTDVQPLQAAHPIDFHYNSWEHISHSYSRPNNDNSNGDQSAVPFETMRAARFESDGRTGYPAPPLFLGSGSGSGAAAASSLVPPQNRPFIAQGNVNEHYPHQNSSVFTSMQRPGGLRALSAMGPTLPPLSDQTIHLFPYAPSGHSSLESDDAGRNRFYAWERDRFAPYPLGPTDHETSWWDPSHQPHVTSDSSRRTTFRQQSGFGRTPSRSRSGGSTYRPTHFPPMQSFM
ncbi:E3 ubiquitin-protein ligase IPI1-like isoform X1 [Typha latifolia]|uniref:E3 ubiquitin-protein ligase IPI1-like isoform X1 n=1 Tax=Typha latifolia TaxID=4733 RepID=UPI003C2D3E72